MQKDATRQPYVFLFLCKATVKLSFLKLPRESRQLQVAIGVHDSLKSVYSVLFVIQRLVFQSLTSCNHPYQVHYHLASRWNLYRQLSVDSVSPLQQPAKLIQDNHPRVAFLPSDS